MDKLEYITGDLVYFETEKAKVEFCNPSTDGSIWVRVIENGGENRIWNALPKHEISPIPLTPSILEKNGWKLSHGFYWSPNEEGAGVGLSSQTGYVWEAYIGRHLLRSNINSVSDLQHLLFGLGLNSEMEV